MGLAVCVGFPAQVRDTDPEFLEYFERQIVAVNKVLESFGLPKHREPFELDVERTFSCEMFGYSGLHYLRRVAAHMTLKNELPLPGDNDAANDPVLKEYYELFDNMVGKEKAVSMSFQHLIIHSDAEGYYLPIEFHDVLVPDSSLEIAGGIIGSSHTLLKECHELAQALELPSHLMFEDEEVWEAADNQGEGETKWRRYGIESYTCLGLIQACKASITTEAAIVFT